MKKMILFHIISLSNYFGFEFMRIKIS